MSSDPFARPSSRNSSSRRYSFDPSMPPLPPLRPGYSFSSGSSLRLPPISSLSLDTPYDVEGPVKLSPLTMPLPTPGSMRRQPSFSRTSSGYPTSPFGSSAPRSTFDAAAPKLENFTRRSRAGSNNMQLDSSPASFRASGLPTLPSLDLSSSPFSGSSRLSAYPDSSPVPRPASVMAPLSGGFDGNTSGDDAQPRSHSSKGMRKYTRRTTFSTAQLEVMERLWKQTEYPNLDQLDVCAAAAGLTSKQVRTWFGNTRQARLAGTRREARNAGIPGVPSSGLPVRGLNEHSLSTLNQLPPSRVPFIATPEPSYATLPPRLGGSTPYSLSSSSSGSSRTSMGASDDDYFKIPRSPYAAALPLAPLPGTSSTRSRRQSFAGYSGSLGPPDLGFSSGLSSSPSSTTSSTGFYSNYAGSPSTRTTPYR